MPVVFLITIVAVLVGIFFAATGRGGELAYEHADHAPLDMGPVTAADVALLRPPTALWGYNMQVTDEALDQIARAMRERDLTIAYLQDQLASFESNRDDSYAEARDAHVRPAEDAPLAPDLAPFPLTPGTPELTGDPAAPETPEAPPPADTSAPATAPPDPEAPEPPQPSQALAPEEAHGPQGAFNAHDWWAEQKEAAREEDGRGDDPTGAAEEQGW